MKPSRVLFRSRHLPFVPLVTILLLSISPAVQAQGSAPENVKPLMYYPQRVPERVLWQSAGLTSVAPPVEITEEFQVRWPAFDYHALYGLPEGFSVDGRAAVQVLQNRISLGPRWATSVGPVKVSLGYDVGYWFGYLKVASFDSKAHGWQGSPNLSIGYRIGSVSATAKVEAMTDFSSTTYQGDLEISNNSKTISGWAYTIALEQPFYKQQYLTLAFRASYTKFYWETWSLFSTFDRYLFFPEVIVGFIL